MARPGLGEVLFILILVAVVFGASKVNPIGDALGGFVRSFRRGLRNDDRITVKPAGDDASKPG